MKNQLTISLAVAVFLAGLLVALFTLSRTIDHGDGLVVAAPENAAESQEIQSGPAASNEGIEQNEPNAFTNAGVTQPGPVDAAPANAGRISALPDLAIWRFDVTTPVHSAASHPARLLAAEDFDPGWAPDMESAILARFQELDTGPMNQLEIECRTSWCGLVVDLPWGEDRHSRMEIANRLRDELGFIRIARFGFGRRDGSGYFAVYFQAQR